LAEILADLFKNDVSKIFYLRTSQRRTLELLLKF